MAELERQLQSELSAAPRPDRKARDTVQARVDDILRPAGAMARLDEVAVWLAGWHGDQPSVGNPAALIFAGDHGVADLSAYPAEVTGAMVQAFRSGRASISAIASVAGASVDVIDVGVGRPTDDIRVGPAMSPRRLVESFEAGRRAVTDLITAEGPHTERPCTERPCTDLLIIGEMGIGNTTAAAAMVGALTGRDASDVVGAGTGVDGDRLAAKRAGVATALDRLDQSAGALSPLQTLRHLGGTELAAMAGAMVEARLRSLPVVLDGYVVGAAALVLQRLSPTAIEHLWAGHCSAEPGHRLVLAELGLRPLLDLDLRLGEASGAMAAVPLIAMACRLVTDVPTFGEWFG